ncbi:hypothetical protein U8C32_12640 [Sinorhizobium medicae]|uniref:hypothetical protein n=1 Tax=Sinorhizobium medicae TaxID=110321 RepID=UPI002AF6B33B|nr:hypothetical protein [Sinorhizobium medicae]WQO44120.1 hypothetical protein U8C42_12790 [Sinorhizobium medicae]WQO66904.1 hypothetical protein U8C40_07110 [Sinorhizobium medicae]WQO71271.1 hypothetical protein U8C31_13275 [Sinorhizobium medicae]WQO90690.1 hypothetical protein U8C32_12640 [Sinorhizobium medicae]
MKREHSFLLGATGAIALGLSPDYAAALAYITSEFVPFEWAILTAIGITAPLLPVALVAAHIFTGMRIHWLLASFLFGLIVLFGTLASLVWVAGNFVLSLSLAHGMTLTLGLASSLFLVSSVSSADARLCFGWVPIGLAGLSGLWSLLMAGLVVLSSIVIADGKPFCVAQASGNRVTGVAAVRGFALYATEATHGLTFEFHAVLVVEGSEQKYNWSYAKLRFFETGYPTSAMEKCTPVEGFWITAGLF